MDPATMALIGGGLQVGQNLLGNLFEKKSTDDARRWQLKMWNMENEYNTPMAQRKRMEAAGFNPNLVYGNGSVANTGKMGNDPPPVELKAPELGGAIQNYITTRQQQQQLEQIELQNQQIKASTIKIGLEGENIATQTQQGGFNLDKDKAMYNTSTEAMRQELRRVTLANEGTEQTNITKGVETQIAFAEYDVKKLEVIGKQLENTTKSAMAKYADKYQQGQLAELNARTQAAIASKSLTDVKKAIDDYEVYLNKHNTSKHDWAPFRPIIVTLTKLKNLYNARLKAVQERKKEVRRTQ